MVNYKYSVGNIIKDNKRDLTIIDRKYEIKEKKDKSCKNGVCNSTFKYYKYRCNKCNNEDWISENNLLYNKRGCNLCRVSPRKVVAGINDIATTESWMLKYFVNKEDGNKYSKSSNKIINMKCPYCNKQKMFSINKLYNRHSIACNCSDSISYPEKLMYNVLSQLGIKFTWQYSKKYCKWIENGIRYDFYFKYNNEEYIIETHGGQHYKNSFYTTVEDQQQKDLFKKELAIKNGIKSENYIIIDCSKSNIDYIKNSIINSKLNLIFDITCINWQKAEIYSETNLSKVICDYWHIHKEINKEKITTGTLKEIFGLSYLVVSTYLKSGTELGWCNYDPKKEEYSSHIEASQIAAQKRMKPVIVYKDDICIGEFKSAKEAANRLNEITKEKFSPTNIRQVCNGDKKTHKGYIFKYVSK